MLVFRGVPLQIGQTLPQKEMNHIIILENTSEFLVNSLLVSEYPWDETSSCWFLKKSIAFPHKFAGLGDHAIDRSLWCLLVLVVVGFWGWSASGSLNTLGLLHSESLHQYCQYRIYCGQWPKLAIITLWRLALCKTWCHPPIFPERIGRMSFRGCFNSNRQFSRHINSKKKLTSSLRSKIPMLGRWFISLLLQNVLFSVVKDSMLVFSTYTV